MNPSEKHHSYQLLAGLKFKVKAGQQSVVTSSLTVMVIIEVCGVITTNTSVSVALTLHANVMGSVTSDHALNGVN